MQKKSPMHASKGSRWVIPSLIGFTLSLGLCLSGSAAEAGTAAQPPQPPSEQERLQKNAENLVAQGRVREAIQIYQRILERDPNFVSALKDLAWIRATSGDPQLRSPDEAVRLAERAFEQMIVAFNSRKNRDSFPPNYDRAHILRVGAALSAAYAAAGRFRAPMDPDFAELVRRGELDEPRALSLSLSSEMAAVTVATWGLEMAQALQRRSPSAETARLVEDLQALLELFSAGRPVDDGRPQPGLTGER